MEQIELLTRFGEYVTTVTVPKLYPQAEIILWGERFFVRRKDGQYYEGMMLPVIDYPTVETRDRIVD